MKKLMILLLALCLLCMTACGEKDDVRQPETASENVQTAADEDAASALVDALRNDDGGDAAGGALPDPGGLLDTSAVQLADQTVNGAVFHVYEYDFDITNGISSIQRTFYESLLKQSGFTMEELEPDDDLSYYLIHGEAGTATLTVTRATAAGKATWTLYVPDGMPFSPSSSSGSFQNDSYVPGGVTGGSFQNGSYTAGSEDPVVIDGLIICTQCGGDGVCPYCHGLGQIKYDLSNYETCVVCDGSGVCDLCGGTGNWGPARGTGLPLHRTASGRSFFIAPG